VSILVINSGSSSLKFSLFEAGSEKSLFAGAVERIGLAGGSFRVKGIVEEKGSFADHDAALSRLFAFLRASGPQDLAIVGHRLVYGGLEYQCPHLVTPELVAALRSLVPFAPEHLPHEIGAIEAVGRAKPALKQYACFDTAFHCGRPRVATRYPIPRELWSEGIQRYGFHGLSYAYILQELEKEAGTEAARARVIIAHLGNGASMAAVKGGRPMDTTMGLTPAGGLMMGTRSGDLDPGVLLYLQETKGHSAGEVREIVNRKSGLLGVSGISSDMQDLLAKERSEDSRAAEAIELYCYLAAKHLGSLAAVLGGLETLVFTAGIGENAPSIRRRICGNLAFLGIRIDSGQNEASAAVISSPGAAVTVRVMKTDEDLMIAREGRQFL
jgi:acetate kinase